MDEQLRRRSVGAPAARSTLLTVLGEYVLGKDHQLFRDTLVSALERLGYKTSTARQAVARSATAGWLQPTRVGRRSRLALTTETEAMLRAGYPRIYGFGDPWDWDGQWLLIVVRLPEQRREARDRLRTKLAWAGFGSLGGGLWISPHVGRKDELRELAEGEEPIAFSARQLDAFGTPESVVAQAWDLTSIAEQYADFVREFRSLRPRSGEATFRAQTALVHAWRKFPFIDPDLPREFLPRSWARDEARDLFQDRHGRWQEGAEAFFRTLTG